MPYFANLECHHIEFATCVHLCQAPSDPLRPWEGHTYGIHDTMSEVAQLPPRVLMKGPQQGPHLDADHCMPLPPGAGGREGDTAKPAECAACARTNSRRCFAVNSEVLEDASAPFGEGNKALVSPGQPATNISVDITQKLSKYI